jgi:hypothetical protein
MHTGGSNRTLHKAIFPRDRVTRCVCEKVAHNEAKLMFAKIWT